MDAPATARFSDNPPDRAEMDDCRAAIAGSADGYRAVPSSSITLRSSRLRAFASNFPLRRAAASRLVRVAVLARALFQHPLDELAVVGFVEGASDDALGGDDG